MTELTEDEIKAILNDKLKRNKGRKRRAWTRNPNPKRKNKLKMRYVGRYQQELERTLEKVYLLNLIINEVEYGELSSTQG